MWGTEAYSYDFDFRRQIYHYMYEVIGDALVQVDDLLFHVDFFILDIAEDTNIVITWNTYSVYN